jgi:hypothetical protein
MKNLSMAIVFCTVAGACAAPADTDSSRPSVVATASLTAGAMAGPTVTYRAVSGVPGNAVASPDGRWIAAPEPPPTTKTSYQPTLLVFAANGTLAKRIAFSGGQWSWLWDSSGIFVALSLPQAPPPLGVIELDGRVTTTQVQLAEVTLSNDGKWIVAERTEGCCASVTRHEINVSARDGTSMRTVVRSEQTVALMGIDPTDRVVYRDGDDVSRIPLAGGPTQRFASGADLSRTIPGTTSPDRSVMLLRGYAPARWYVFANDRLAEWSNSAGSIVEDGNGIALKDGPNAMWIGPHTLLVRDDVGALFAYDALTSVRVAFAARLAVGDVVLAHQSGSLLALREQHAVLIDLATGAMRETGLDVGNEIRGVLASALPAGGFLLSNTYATYRIE